MVLQAFFIIEWLHEGAKGVNQTAGFQAYIDGKKAGNVLDPNFFKAKIASKPEKLAMITKANLGKCLKYVLK